MWSTALYIEAVWPMVVYIEAMWSTALYIEAVWPMVVYIEASVINGRFQTMVGCFFMDLWEQAVDIRTHSSHRRFSDFLSHVHSLSYLFTCELVIYLSLDLLSHTLSLKMKARNSKTHTGENHFCVYTPRSVILAGNLPPCIIFFLPPPFSGSLIFLSLPSCLLLDIRLKGISKSNGQHVVFPVFCRCTGSLPSRLIIVLFHPSETEACGYRDTR